MPKTKRLPERDRAIAAALDTKQASVAALANQYGLNRSSVYRAAERGRAAVETMAAVPRAVKLDAGGTFSELGTTGLRRFGGRIDDEYDRVFKSLPARIALYREMGDDPIVAAVLQAIRMLIRRAGWHAEPGGETDADKLAAEFLQQCMDDMSLSWNDLIDQALVMFQYGFQLAELVYKPRRGPREESVAVSYEDAEGKVFESRLTLPKSKYNDNRVGWRKFTFIAPDSLDHGEPWLFDEHGGLRGFRQSPYTWGGQQVAIPIQKAVLFRTTTEKGNPEGRALLRAMYQPWYFKHNLEEIEAISAERTGAGFPVVYMGDDLSKSEEAGSDWATLKDIIRNVRVDDQMGLVLPWAKMGGGAREGEGVLFELVSPPGQGVVNFHETITRHEQRMAMVGLAQFIHLGMNQVGARSLGESSTDFFTLSVSGWVDSIAETLQRFAVERLFEHNHFPGMTALPIITHDAIAQTNVLEVAEYVNKLAGAQLLTASAELERSLLELADLPANPKLDEIYEQKDKAREAAIQQLAEAPAPGTAPEPGETPALPGKDEEPVDKRDDSALIAELRRATELLAISQRLELMTVQTAAAPAAPVVVNIDNRPDKVVVENATFNAPAPDMLPVAEAIGVLAERQQAAAERMADAHSAQVDAMAVRHGQQLDRSAIAIEALAERPIIVQVPEQPAPVVHVAPAQVTVIVPEQPAPVINVTADVKMPETEETITIERDGAGLMKGAKKVRRAKRAG